MTPHVNAVVKTADASAKPRGSTWESTFPADIEKPSDSAIFMTRLLYVSFSHILQSRRLVPSTAFRKRVIDDCVRSYVPNLKDEVGIRLSSKLRGASLAIEKGYLDELIIVVNPTVDDENVAIEVFKWKMHYHENGECSSSILDSNGLEQLAVRYTGLESSKKKTIAMLQAIRYLCFELLGPLPSSATASLMITYTDAAPKGFQADGFRRCPTMYSLDKNARSVDLSVIPAPHHTVCLSVDSVYVEDEYAIKAKLADRSGGSLSLSLNSTTDDLFNKSNTDEPTDTPMVNRVSEVVLPKPIVVASRSPSKPGRKRNQRKTATPETTVTSAAIEDEDSAQSKKSRKSRDVTPSKRTPGLTKHIMMAESPESL